MAYSLVGTDGGCGELDLFFVAARLGVDLFLEAAQGGEGRGHLGGHPAAPQAQVRVHLLPGSVEGGVNLWARHAADAFRTAAVMVREPEKKKEQEKRKSPSRLSPWS